MINEKDLEVIKNVFDTYISFSEVIDVEVTKLKEKIEVLIEQVNIQKEYSEKMSNLKDKLISLSEDKKGGIKNAIRKISD